ncbi:MAG: alkaline phosphatase D family protein [Saprospiraceae bacterium]
MIMNTTSRFFLFFLFLIAAQLQAQEAATFERHPLLQSGPMLGYTDMFESLIWVQTKEAAQVQAAYWLESSPQERHLTNMVRTKKADGFVAHLLADEVEPGNHYQYEVFINNERVELPYPTVFQTVPLWQYRTDPPTMKIALGSCSYINEEEYDRPGRPYGGDYQIFEAIYEQDPDFMLWLGDNVYLREPDWYTRTGFLHRYTHTRSLPEMQPLLASTHHYAIWDDHDYGTNDSDRSFVYKDLAKEIFGLFWPNPRNGLPGMKGNTSFFQWGDADFFLLDNRSFRTPNRRNTGDCTILGRKQLDWLIDALVTSRATWKFVAIGGQVLTSFADFETYAKLCPMERDYLLRQIEREGIKNVIFLTGDRHHTELCAMVNAAGNTVYDFTVSPLTSGAHDTDEPNLYRVPGTMVTERNFGIMEISGPRKERQLIFKIFDVNGELLWSESIKAE